MKITRHAKNLLSATRVISTDDEFNEHKKIFRREARGVHHLTLAKIGALSNIALALTSPDIQISDFLRYVSIYMVVVYNFNFYTCCYLT